MRRLRVLCQHARSLFRGAKADAELARELAFHLEQLTRENIDSGMAQRTLGGVAQIEEQCRDQTTHRLDDGSAEGLRLRTAHAGQVARLHFAGRSHPGARGRCEHRRLCALRGSSAALLSLPRTGTAGPHHGHARAAGHQPRRPGEFPYHAAPGRVYEWYVRIMMIAAGAEIPPRQHLGGGERHECCRT